MKTWEFDARNHPIPKKNDNAKFSITRYQFDREQYITEIKNKFNWLKNHPRKSSLDSYVYMFDSAIFDIEIFYHSKSQPPFEKEAKIVVGYTDKFRQAWIWIETDDYVSFPVQRFFPNCEMWAKFSDWTSIWNKERECAYPNKKTVLVSNQKAEDLAKAIQKYWGDVANVSWEEIISDSTPCTLVRHRLEV